MRTVLKVVDNSGAKKVMCIQALKGKKGAKLGETIVVSVKEALPNGKAKKGNVYHAVVVRAAMQRGRCDGSEVKFDDNACVLIDKQGQPIGTRVFGPVPHELRKKNHVKILTLAQHIAWSDSFFIYKEWDLATNVVLWSDSSGENPFLDWMSLYGISCDPDIVVPWYLVNK